MRPEQLTGFDFQALHKACGKPWTKAMEEGDELAIYAYVWIVEKRDDKTLTFEAVQMRTFQEVIDRFTALNDEAVDPTSDRSGPD
ncbi:MAG: hypothetical protein DWP92_01655 [Armatimonadetes bacterium]|nr:MAG: hypothetical protein DWP92_01655 [Armatimonadota bacterium]